MSIEASKWAWSCPVKGIDKLVLLALADHASAANGNRAWPSLDRLAWMASTDRRNVTRAIARLQSAGYIERSRSSGGSGKSTRYLLCIDTEQGRETPDEQGRDAPPTGANATPNRGVDAQKQGRETPRITIEPLKNPRRTCPQCGKEHETTGILSSCGPCLMRNERDRVVWDEDHNTRIAKRAIA